MYFKRNGFKNSSNKKFLGFGLNPSVPQFLSGKQRDKVLKCEKIRVTLGTKLNLLHSAAHMSKNIREKMIRRYKCDCIYYIELVQRLKLFM